MGRYFSEIKAAGLKLFMAGLICRPASLSRRVREMMFAAGSLIGASVGFAGLASALSLDGFQFENVGDLSFDRMVLSSGYDEDRMVLVIIQPLIPTISDRTRKDPFTEEEIYEKTVVTCNFQYYFGNIYGSRIALNPSGEIGWNVVRFVFRNSETGKSEGINTQARGVLDAAEGQGDDAIVNGYTGFTETDTYRKDFPSREAASKAMWEICDIASMTNIEIQPMSFFQVEGQGEVSPVDAIYVLVADNDEFARRRLRE